VSPKSNAEHTMLSALCRNRHHLKLRFNATINELLVCKCTQQANNALSKQTKQGKQTWKHWHLLKIYAPAILGKVRCVQRSLAGSQADVRPGALQKLTTPQLMLL
jgi:hypothetical protein